MHSGTVNTSQIRAELCLLHYRADAMSSAGGRLGFSSTRWWLATRPFTATIKSRCSRCRYSWPQAVLCSAPYSCSLINASWYLLFTVPRLVQAICDVRYEMPAFFSTVCLLHAVFMHMPLRAASRRSSSCCHSRLLYCCCPGAARPAQKAAGGQPSTAARGAEERRSRRASASLVCRPRLGGIC